MQIFIVIIIIIITKIIIINIYIYILRMLILNKKGNIVCYVFVLTDCFRGIKFLIYLRKSSPICQV